MFVWAAALLVLAVVWFFDKELAAGLILFFVLTLGTVAVLWRRGQRNLELYALFAAALFVHGGFVLFVYYTGFQPLSGVGDYTLYHRVASDVAVSLKEGTFSLEALARPPSAFLFPVFIGGVYALFGSAMVVGQLFNAWVASIAVLLLYFLASEFHWRLRAVLVGFVALLYPSFLFFSSFLLKESLVIALSLGALLLTVHMLREFTLRKFLVFALILVALSHLRVYVGVIMAFTFLVSWMFLGERPLHRRLLFFLPMVFALGFVFPLSLQSGSWFAADVISKYGNPQAVRFYKEEAFLPSQTSPGAFSFVQDLGISFENPASFATSFARSFLFSVLGPFPWQFQAPRHFFALGEGIPWLVLFLSITVGIVRRFRAEPRSPQFVTLVFALGMFAFLALFVNNFGQLLRLRIPAVLVLLPFLAHGLWQRHLDAALQKIVSLYVQKRYRGGEAMKRVIEGLGRRGVELASLRALEMFAGEGDFHTQTYAHKVKSLDAWEYNPHLLAGLKRNVPQANILRTDSVQEAKRKEHKKRYGLVVVDGPPECYGPDNKYCEYFDVLPDACSMLQEQGIVVLTVHRKQSDFANPRMHTQRRAEFYGVEDASDLSIPFLMSFFKRFFRKQGYSKEFSFAVSRGASHHDDSLYYFVFSLKRRGSGPR